MTCINWWGLTNTRPCYGYNDIRLAAFLIEQNGDTAVPDDERYITYEAKEAVTWTCGKN